MPAGAVMQVDELLSYIFDGQPHVLAPSMSTWIVSSRRFSAFVTAFRDKIRKKLRTTQEQETLQDLRLELETAYLLLQESPFHLTYEPQCGQARCPDFAVTFTTRLTFMIEITRLRALQKGGAALLPEENSTAISVQADTLADTICSKMGQLIHQHSNVLVVGVEALHLAQSDLQAAMLRVQQRAERNDPTYWQRYRFRDRAEFFRYYQRLSEVLVREAPLQSSTPVIAWVNPQTKYPLPARIRTSLYRCHTV